MVNPISLIPGNPAPDFSGKAVINGEFKDIKLKDYAKSKYVYLLFYPMDFTFVCPTELCAFSDAAAKFEELECQVIGVSTDSEFSHLAWTNQPRAQGGVGQLKFPLLADKSMKISTDYGVLKDGAGIAYRGLFLIDKQGVLKHCLVNDLGIGRSVDEAIRTLEALRFTEENGEVCPANWRPKDKAIKPTVKGSKEYFGALN